MGRPGVIRLKYVHAFRDRFGRMRYYFRRHGIRTALSGLPGSTEFMEVYAAALASAPPKDATFRPNAAPGTFDALAARYFGSAQYLSLSATSRANYRRVIGSFLKEHGHRLVRQMTREHVDIIVGKMANKPGAGIILLKRLRTLVRYAIALGWIDRDPTAGAKSYRSKEIHTWNEEEIAAFEKHLEEGVTGAASVCAAAFYGTARIGRAPDVMVGLRRRYHSGSAAEDSHQTHNSSS